MFRLRMLLPLVALASGCILDKPSPTGGRINGLTLELLDPTVLGTAANPIATRSARINLTANDDQGNLVADDVDVDLYLASGGIRTGALRGCSVTEASKFPLATAHLVGGQALDYFLDLPNAFGASSIWAEIPSASAAGASPVINFRNPFISDLITPIDPMALNAAFCNPYTGKFVRIDAGTGTGRLVVSARFTNAFVITDTGASKFNALYIFTFSAPSERMVVGKPIDWVTGNVAKFVGYSQLSFPRAQASDDPPDPSLLPPPVKLAIINLPDIPTMLGYVSRTVEVTGRLCNPFPDNPTGDANIQNTRDSWQSFNQFVLDADTTCQSISNFSIALPAKKVGDFDPLAQIGKTFTIRGVLRNNSGQNTYTDANNIAVTCDASTPCLKGTCGSDNTCKKNPYNFWTVFPSSADDIQ